MSSDFDIIFCIYHPNPRRCSARQSMKSQPSQLNAGVPGAAPNGNQRIRIRIESSIQVTEALRLFQAGSAQVSDKRDLQPPAILERLVEPGACRFNAL